MVFKWLLVLVAAFAWIIVVPIVDLVRSGLGRLRPTRSQR